MPSTPPSVTYQDRQLTIVAQNSTLADILSAVRHKTGAEFDVPTTASERVVGRFGPGPARDVLATLLNGSHFNYVMVGTEAEPNSVAHVILTVKRGEETGPMPGGQPGQPPSVQQAGFPQPGQTQPLQPSQAIPHQQMQGSTEPIDDDQANADDSADAAEEDASDQEGNGQPQNPNQPAVKTPEQLLQELQRQQQLIQQQQQQGQSQPQGQTQPGVQPAQPPQLIYSNPPQQKPEE